MAHKSHLVLQESRPAGQGWLYPFLSGEAQSDEVAYLRIYNMHNRISVLSEVSATPRNTGGGGLG